jgi:hypothetical protein
MAERTRPLRVSANRAAFTRLYRAEMDAMRRFAETLPPDEARWYRLLGERSDAELAAWDGKRFLDGYLRVAGRIRIRAFGVLAHAYLHVAYDFPRFLADSFAVDPELSRERRYRAYVLGSEHVFESVLAHSRRPSALGLCGALMRMLPGDRPAARLAGGWFLAHRCAAWTVAESLAASDHRAELEERLREGIDHAARTMRGLSPLRWLRELPLASDLVPDGPAAACYPPDMAMPARERRP